MDIVMNHSARYGVRIRFIATTTVEERIKAYATSLGMDTIECVWNGGGMDRTGLQQLELHIGHHCITIYFTEQQLLGYLDGRNREDIDLRIQAVLHDLDEMFSISAAEDLVPAVDSSSRPGTGFNVVGRCRYGRVRKTRH